MKLRRFCSKCGISIKENTHIYKDFVCEQCFGKIESLDDNTLKLQIRKCIYCNAFSLRNREQEFKWLYHPENEPEIDFMSKILYNNIFLKIEEKTKQRYELFFNKDFNLYDNADINLLIQISSDDHIKVKEESIIIKKKEIHCPYCAKKKGGRFDAIVQIRLQHPNDKNKLDEVMNDIKKIEKKENFRNVQNFISIIDPTINGFDLKVSTNAMARVIISKIRTRYHFEIKFSKKLIGVEQETGSDLYRLSTLLRLLPIEPKKKFLLEGIPYIVNNITKNKITIKNIDTNKISQVNYNIFQKKRWKLIDTE